MARKMWVAQDRGALGGVSFHGRSSWGRRSTFLRMVAQDRLAGAA